MVRMPLLREYIRGGEAVCWGSRVQSRYDAVESLPDQPDTVQLVPHGHAVFLVAGVRGDSGCETVGGFSVGDEHVTNADGHGERVPCCVIERRGRAGEAAVFGEGDGFNWNCVARFIRNLYARDG